MAKDLMYYYTKNGNLFIREEFGEIQQDFNMSMVIDGTKDSMKAQVLSFSELPLVPYTIVYHASTQTWWVVSHDKIERFEHEGNAYWLHELELLGAIELLNARDLTDCGFTDNVYTIWQFLGRLFKLSNFEYRVVGLGGDLTIETNYLDKDLKVDFLKTFENYTLLSGIREFLDGYNATAKLSFTTNQVGNINGAKLTVIPKTGKSDSVYQESVFNDVRETKTMDKDSYGTTIVSNAQNVVSTKAKTYPTVGAVRLSSTEYEIKPENACIRLPSPAYKVNWVKMYSTKLMISFDYLGTLTDYVVDTTNLESCQRLWQDLLDNKLDGSRLEDFLAKFPNASVFMEKIQSLTVATFYDSEYQYNTTISVGEYTDDPTNLFVPTLGDKLPPLFMAQTTQKYWALGKKALHDGITLPYQVMYWEMGSDLIKGFDYFEKNKYASYDGGTIRFKPDSVSDFDSNVIIWSNDGRILKVNTIYVADSQIKPTTFEFNYVSFQVNYIPMSDVKIKLDNDGTNNDTQYYNQTGKLTDSNALSKLLLSYSKEIESTTITKYGTYYDFDTMPSVGSIVLINNKPYVINNISYNFQENEDDSYIIFAEFTLAIYTSTKSLMVNPNTSIRDYAIPQNFNVKRKQTYRDYWELSYTSGGDNNIYLPIAKTLNIGNYYQEYNSHICLIETTFSDGITKYYYQLETTTFVFKKSIYEVLDFKDNNIIGYSSCNRTTGFNIQRLLNNQVVVNTPISYVDEIGRVRDIDIMWCNRDQLESAYVMYQSDNGISLSVSLYNYSVFIGQGIWSYVDYPDFQITEEYYNKDATEVPVFEYCSQFGNSDDCEIGDNIFDCLSTDIQYFYVFDLVNKGSINNDNFSSLEGRTISQTSDYTGTWNICHNACIMKWASGKLRIYFLENFQINVATNQVRFDTMTTTPTGFALKDVVIRRLTLTPESVLNMGTYENVKNDLLFVIKNTQNAITGTQTITTDFGYSDTCWYVELTPNHYKLN